MGKHTPGPWKVLYPLNVTAGRRVVASCGGYYTNAEDVRAENKANAHLISAAPEMYEALKMALSYLPAKDGKRVPGDPDSDVQLMIANKIKQALHKAEGGESA